MPTEKLVVVHANPGGQAEAVCHAPFVFGEQRFFGHRGVNPRALWAGVVPVCFQLVLLPLGTGDKHVTVKRQGQFALEHRVGDFRRDTLVTRLNVAFAGGLFPVQADIGGAEIPVAGVRQHVAVTGVLVIVFHRSVGERLARCVPEFLLSAAGFEHELLLVIRRQPQACGACLAVRLGKPVEHFVFAALLVEPPQLNAEAVFDQWPREVSVQLRGVTRF